MKIKKIFKDQSGLAMVLALIMLMILSLIGLATSYNSIFEIKLSGNKRGNVDAFYGADSGVQIVVANAENFNLDKFVSDKYDPFTDGSNPNVTKAKVVIEHYPDRKGAPRGFGISAANFNFEHYMVESTGDDSLDLSTIKSTCTIDQKMVRLVPTLQGGY
jgi:competence protein ComGC